MPNVKTWKLRDIIGILGFVLVARRQNRNSDLSSSNNKRENVKGEKVLQ